MYVCMYVCMGTPGGLPLSAYHLQVYVKRGWLRGALAGVVDWSNRDLRGAQLQGVVLSGADLTGTILEDANLQKVASP